MTPPRELFRVEWSIAFDYDHPHDRHEESRNFTTAYNAARQVALVQLWVPQWAELHGVFRTVGSAGPDLAWRRVPLGDLPALSDQDQQEMRFRRIAQDYVIDRTRERGHRATRSNVDRDPSAAQRAH